VPLRLETWGPFLFVNPDEDAPPLAETLGPLPDLPPVDDLVFHSRDEFEVAANWKIACENYLECYHCPVAHKGFSAAYDVDPDEYRLEPISEHVLSQFAHTREEGEGEGQAQFHFVSPNLRINVFAGRRTFRSARFCSQGLTVRPGSSTTSLLPTPIRAGWRSCSPSTGRSEPRIASSSSGCRRVCGRGSSPRGICWARASSSSRASRSSSRKRFGRRDRPFSIRPNDVFS
jgi:phenylpropionate dioxygenase-like ring-hydroxylating dioxygenase large terminal subunit